LISVEEGMGNPADLLHPTAEQYRERAKLIRYTAEAVKNALPNRANTIRGGASASSPSASSASIDRSAVTKAPHLHRPILKQPRGLQLFTH
jgi:hypothetical protein